MKQNTKTNRQNPHQQQASEFSKPEQALLSQAKETSDESGPHFPVLLEQVLQYLDPQEKDTYLDLTAGYGGHAKAILERTLHPLRATLVDRDQFAIAYLKEKFAGDKVQIIQKDFLHASLQLENEGKQYNLILADLGVSSPHLDEASRGFSFKAEAPLDMRMDREQSLTAETIVNSYSQSELADILKSYGEEPKAHKIAHMIVANRPIKTTTQLANLVARAWPRSKTSGLQRGKPGPAHKVHPATRSFQALRIAVNDELTQLKTALPIWLKLLAPGGRIVIITFHSLEDRIVKNFFREHAGDHYDAVLQLLTKGPVSADEAEVAFNPRARSAKLRAAAKIKTKNQKRL